MPKQYTDEQWTAIETAIRNILSGEPKERPFTDALIAQRLRPTVGRCMSGGYIYCLRRRFGIPSRVARKTLYQRGLEWDSDSVLDGSEEAKV